MEDKQEIPESIPELKKKSSINPKVFIIGLPLFIVQLVIVYFITANILLNKTPAKSSSNKETVTNISDTSNGQQKKRKENFGKYIYSLDDVIVNPAGTSGQRLMLASVNIDVGQEEHLKFLKEREPIVKDLIISIMSSKSLFQLGQVGFKDTLKIELTKSLSLKFGNISFNDIYFSKYIMQ
ncbi:MAG: flagellar basal body-associated FliL family protein [Ignavibacteriales bacterium]|nr:flagellar basal body-associated FliL family protein [Ignavibacteriales bacterium]